MNIKDIPVSTKIVGAILIVVIIGGIYLYYKNQQQQAIVYQNYVNQQKQQEEQQSQEQKQDQDRADYLKGLADANTGHIDNRKMIDPRNMWYIKGVTDGIQDQEKRGD